MTKSTIVKETDNYKIRKIPLNYRIDIKKTLVRRIPNHAIERDWYSDIEHPLQEAIDLAERVSVEHFRPITMEELKINELKSQKFNLNPV